MSLFGAKRSPALTAPVRPAAVAGAFYPADPGALQTSVNTYLEQATLPPLNGTVRAVIAPHAGYIYSGPVAGYSFRALSLSTHQEHVVFLMGPAHYVPVSGVAVGWYQALSTPLGELPVETELVAQLLEKASVFSERNDAHAPEHCLEVELPFLQSLNSAHLRIVPLLFGQVPPERVVETLTPYLRDDPTSRLVISSDLSHFHAYGHAKRIDMALLDAIVRRDMSTVARGEACGRIPILTLMLIAERLGWQPHLLDYKNSGDTAGDRQRVVGYGAIAYTEA
ncbi:MAG TPA: AmmeMemoRadiSam system protein B [Caldilineae bacterium]|nr:AmmeMemoRadiSam system protein B [Caldilineae bacterium]